jgi:hypothetical protein
MTTGKYSWQGIAGNAMFMVYVSHPMTISVAVRSSDAAGSHRGLCCKQIFTAFPSSRLVFNRLKEKTCRPINRACTCPACLLF